MEQRDYIIDQIEKAAQFIASLITNRKNEAKDQVALDQTLSALTGLDHDFFANGDPRLLKTVLPMLNDNNVKALAARLLQQKDPEIYGELYKCLMANINRNELAPKVRALFTEK